MKVAEGVNTRSPPTFATAPTAAPGWVKEAMLSVSPSGSPSLPSTEITTLDEGSAATESSVATGTLFGVVKVMFTPAAEPMLLDARTRKLYLVCGSSPQIAADTFVSEVPVSVTGVASTMSPYLVVRP